MNEPILDAYVNKEISGRIVIRDYKELRPGNFVWFKHKNGEDYSVTVELSIFSSEDNKWWKDGDDVVFTVYKKDFGRKGFGYYAVKIKPI